MPTKPNDDGQIHAPISKITAVHCTEVSLLTIMTAPSLLHRFCGTIFQPFGTATLQHCACKVLASSAARLPNASSPIFIVDCDRMGMNLLKIGLNYMSPPRHRRERRERGRRTIVIMPPTPKDQRRSASRAKGLLAYRSNVRSSSRSVVYIGDFISCSPHRGQKDIS